MLKTRYISLMIFGLGLTLFIVALLLQSDSAYSQKNSTAKRWQVSALPAAPCFANCETLSINDTQQWSEKQDIEWGQAACQTCHATTPRTQVDFLISDNLVNQSEASFLHMSKRLIILSLKHTSAETEPQYQALVDGYMQAHDYRLEIFSTNSIAKMRAYAELLPELDAMLVDLEHAVTPAQLVAAKNSSNSIYALPQPSKITGPVGVHRLKLKMKPPPLPKQHPIFTEPMPLEIRWAVLLRRGPPVGLLFDYVTTAGRLLSSVFDMPSPFIFSLFGKSRVEAVQSVSFTIYFQRSTFKEDF
jgi:hypothetical protein